MRQVQTLSQKRAGWEENQKVFGSLIESTQGRIFTVEDMGVFLGQVSKKASESGVELQTSNPLAEKTVFPDPYDQKYLPSGYEFTVEGGYHSLGNFVSRIEGHEKLLRIQSLKISPSKKTPGKNVAELKLWAILKAPPQAAKPAKSAKDAKTKTGSAKTKAQSAKK
jgi:Tfp pilus assembly protein PilO